MTSPHLRPMRKIGVSSGAITVVGLSSLATTNEICGGPLRVKQSDFAWEGGAADRAARQCCIESVASRIDTSVWPVAIRLPGLQRFLERRVRQGDASAKQLLSVGRERMVPLEDFWWLCLPAPLAPALAPQTITSDLVLRSRLRNVVERWAGLRPTSYHTAIASWGGRDIEVVPVQEARLRPLLRSCADLDAMTREQRNKARHHCTADGCDSYKTGRGECLLNVNGFGSNLCYFRGLKERWYCPVSAPLAVLAIPKVASTSISDWMARLDGSLWLHASSMRASIFSGNCSTSQGSELRKQCATAISGVLQRALHGVSDCTMAHLEKLRRRILDTLSISGGEVAYVQGPFCHTCCATAAGRTRVVIVRNPFARIKSYFLNNWGGIKRASFSRFLSIATWDTRLCDPHHFGGNCSGRSKFGRQDRLHIWPVAATLKNLAEEGANAELVVIHMESMSKDTFDALGARLCKYHGYCQGLDVFAQRNQVAPTRGASDEWRASWSKRNQEKVLRWYADDFYCFGYGKDTTQLSPVNPLPESCGPFKLITL